VTCLVHRAIALVVVTTLAGAPAFDVVCALFCGSEATAHAGHVEAPRAHHGGHGVTGHDGHSPWAASAAGAADAFVGAVPAGGCDDPRSVRLDIWIASGRQDHLACAGGIGVGQPAALPAFDSVRSACATPLTPSTATSHRLGVPLRI
jgi:hypothetical protein